MAAPAQKSKLETKLATIIHSETLTIEDMASAAHISYPTLRNVFSRHIISPLTLMKLMVAKIITKDEVAEYNEWARETGKRVPRLPHEIKRRKPNGDDKVAAGGGTEHAKPAGRSKTAR